MDKWLKIGIDSKQVTANEHLKLEEAISSVHEANDQPMFWLVFSRAFLDLQMARVFISSLRVQRISRSRHSRVSVLPNYNA